MCPLMTPCSSHVPRKHPAGPCDDAAALSPTSRLETWQHIHEYLDCPTPTRELVQMSNKKKKDEDREGETTLCIDTAARHHHPQSHIMNTLTLQHKYLPLPSPPPPRPPRVCAQGEGANCRCCTHSPAIPQPTDLRCFNKRKYSLLLISEMQVHLLFRTSTHQTSH